MLPGSNRAKYCKPCAAKTHRKQKNASDRKRRLPCGQLETKKPWYCRAFQRLSVGRQYKSLLSPESRLKTVRRGNFTYPGFSRSGGHRFLLCFVHSDVKPEWGYPVLDFQRLEKLTLCTGSKLSFRQWIFRHFGEPQIRRKLKRNQ